MKRLVAVVVLVVALVALTMLTGCPKKEQTSMNVPPGVPPGQPGATHTMPNGMPMAGAQHPGAVSTASDPAAKSSDMASCPVLGTTMPKKDMIAYEYKGKTYYLCCKECVDAFKANPEKYIKNPHAPLPAGQGMGG